MRRTDFEFKQELLHRAREYRVERAAKRRRILTVSACVLLCVVGLYTFRPNIFQKSVADTAAPEAWMENSAAVMREPETCLDTPAEAPAAPIIEEERKSEAVDVGEGLLYGKTALTLDEADCAAVLALLQGEWTDGETRCLVDYQLVLDGITYQYHAECGTFQDELRRALTLEEADRLAVNEILQKYCKE